jgi:hypothetical protein
MTSWHEYRQYELENGGMDDPPYCPRCGAYTASGVYCEKCRDSEPGGEEPGNVCGRKLHTDEEDRIGMCEVCGNL